VAKITRISVKTYLASLLQRHETAWRIEITAFASIGSAIARKRRSYLLCRWRNIGAAHQQASKIISAAS